MAEEGEEGEGACLHIHTLLDLEPSLPLPLPLLTQRIIRLGFTNEEIRVSEILEMEIAVTMIMATMAEEAGEDDEVVEDTVEEVGAEGGEGGEGAMGFRRSEATPHHQQEREEEEGGRGGGELQAMDLGGRPMGLLLLLLLQEGGEGRATNASSVEAGGTGAETALTNNAYKTWFIFLARFYLCICYPLLTCARSTEHL